MFDDMKNAVHRQPRPASEARLRAMARHLTRPGDDPQAEEDRFDLIRAAQMLPRYDREVLAAMLREGADATN